MAKDNLFLGKARGSVGDVTFYQVRGVQVSRARNRSPRNPRSPLQLLQRVLMKTTSTAYSFMQPICDHSFQNLSEGTPNQSRFAVLNVAGLRSRLAAIINSGDAEEILTATEANFSTKDSNQCQFNAYQVSEGTLPAVNVQWSSESTAPYFRFSGQVSEGVPSSTFTYQQIVDMLGLQRGDQLTFMFFGVDDTQTGGTFNSLDVARVILEPSSGDMSAAFLSGSAVNLPNDKNDGSINFAVSTDTEVSEKALYVYPSSMESLSGQSARTVAGCAIIASRLVGGVWQRSSQFVVLRPYTTGTNNPLAWDHGTNYLADAIYSYMSDTTSTLYLNQANS